MSKLPSRILVGVGFSDEGSSVPRSAASEQDRALFAQALWLAQKLGASLHLFHCIEVEDLEFVDGRGRLHRLIEEQVSVELQRMVDQADAALVEARFSIRHGQPSHQLLEEVRGVGADLVMVGPHRPGYALLERLLHGSTAQDLLRRCPVSLWVTHPSAPASVQSAIVPLDLGPGTARLVGIAESFRAATGAELHALHCVSYTDDMVLWRYPDGAERVVAYHAQVRSAARAALAAAVAQDPSWNVLVSEDSVWGALERGAAAQEYDVCIIAGTSGASLANRLLGSTAEKVLSLVPATMWVVR
jgi:universal stress protein E